MAQEWLNRRFAGLTPSHFKNSTFIYGIQGLEPPPLFRDVWCTFDASSVPSVENNLKDFDSILILCSPSEEQHIKGIKTLLSYLSVGEEFPPVFWAPHTIAPEEQETVEPYDQGLFAEIMEYGLDDVIDREYEGMELSTAVLTRAQKSGMLASMLNAHLEQRRRDARSLEFIRALIDDTLWGHLRARCAPAIPPVDPDLEAGDLQGLPGYNFGRMLGKGSRCIVYALTPVQGNNNPNETTEVVKILDKSKMTESETIKQMGRMADIMLLLSKDEYSHPNITQLHGIYHSSTHIFFRETFGGPENLFNRLTHRQQLGEAQRPLSLVKITQLITQLCTAIAHLHTVAHVCHRDVKPENVLINETPDALFMKLTDFDLAMLQRGTVLCKKPCGTLPFIAPEVLLQREYDGMAADIWSLGVVLLEIQCGISIMERYINTQHPTFREINPASADNREITGNMIKSSFSCRGSASKLLEDNCWGDLKALLPVTKPLVDGMCNVSPETRLTAQQTSQTLAELQNLTELPATPATLATPATPAPPAPPAPPALPA